jgi:hypothetical protein
LDSNEQHFALLGIDLQASSIPLSLVDSPDGLLWGAIPDCLAPYPRTDLIPAGPIIVPRGNIAEGYDHIVKKHGRKIADVANGTIDAYLCDVLRRYQKVFLQPDGSLWVFRSNGITKCAVVSPIHIGGKTLYKLITAYPIARLPDLRKRGIVELRYN